MAFNEAAAKSFRAPAPAPRNAPAPPGPRGSLPAPRHPLRVPPRVSVAIQVPHTRITAVMPSELRGEVSSVRTGTGCTSVEGSDITSLSPQSTGFSF